MFSKKATKTNEIYTVNLTVTTYCQIDGEDFVNFCGLLRKRELYLKNMQVTTHLKLAFFQTGEFPGIEKSSMSVYLGSRYALYLLTQQTNV